MPSFAAPETLLEPLRGVRGVTIAAPGEVGGDTVSGPRDGGWRRVQAGGPYSPVQELRREKPRPRHARKEKRRSSSTGASAGAMRTLASPFSLSEAARGDGVATLSELMVSWSKRGMGELEGLRRSRGAGRAAK
jgi:hypothetical protein